MKPPASPYFALLALALILAPPPGAPLLAANNQSCGNTSAPTREPDCDTGCDGESSESSDCQGSNVFRAYTGNAYRPIKDLEVFGGVGQHRLRMERYGMSRFTGSTQWFGQGGNWRHSYQWEMADAGTDSQGRALVDVFFPQGNVMRFTQVSATDWVPEAKFSERIYQSGSLFVMRTGAGWDYEFLKSGSTYRLQRFIDSEGNLYAFSYDGSNRLHRVTEPGGRFLEFTYASLPYTNVKIVGLATISGVPANGTWTELATNHSSSFRYFRYKGPNNTRSPIAEFKVFEHTTNASLTGTPVGAVPSENPSTGFENASDGDTATYYSYSRTKDGWAGIDLGAAKRAGKFQFFPAAGFEAQMNGGKFEGLNELPATVTVISKVTTSDGREVSYAYGDWQDPELPYIYKHLTGVDYEDGGQAAYSYTQLWSNARPLLKTAVDPHVESKVTGVEYEYESNAAYGALGVIEKERNLFTGGVLAQLNGIGQANQLQVVYPNGRTEVLYQKADFGGHIGWRRYSDGTTANFTYDQNGYGYLISERDRLGRTKNYARTAQGRILTETRADGSATAYTRDAFGRELTRTESGTGIANRTTTYTRDGFGRPTRIDHPDSSYEEMTYNALGQAVTHRLRNGATVTRGFDATGRKLYEIGPDGGNTTFTYNTMDLVETETDPLGRVTTYEYDLMGRVTKITHPDSTFVAFTYDALGNQLTRTDELGNTWTTQYDEFRRPVSVTDPLNRTTYTSYDHLGNGGGGCGSCNDSDKPASITFPSGRIVSFTYDAEWRLLSQTDGVNTPDAATTSYTYDAEGNMLTTTDPMGRVWTFQYDNRNRRTKAIDPLGHTTEWTYDAQGNALTVKRPDNGVTTNVYDSRNRLVSSTDPKGQTTSFEYGGTAVGTQGDNLVRLTDGRGNSYTFEYDEENRQTKMIYPDASFESWSYDDAGNMVQYRARNGATMTCTIDNRNRDTFCDWSDATTDAAKTYDAVGRVTGLDNGIANLTYTYDAAGQLLTETQNPSAVAAGVDPGSWTVTYAYDADGARESVTYPSGTVVSYTYTGRKQVATISADGPPPLATFSYNPNGSRIGKVLENTTSVVYGYDNANRLTSVDHLTGNASFMRFDYALNSVGNRLSKNATGSAVPGGSWLEAYSHDAVDQLIGANYTTTAAGNRTVGYQYDAVGNRELLNDSALAASIPYTANNLNQYTMVDSLPVPTYDANGNLLTFNPDGTGPSAQTFTYDSNDKLLTATRNGTTVTTHYDAHRRAVARTVAPSAGSPVTTFFVWDDWSLIEERTVTGNLVQSYVHGPVIDEILAKTDSAGTVYYHHDGLGSTTALTNATGTPVESYTYDAYGAARVWDGAGVGLASSAFGNRFLFTGREWVAEAGIYDYRNRAYSAELGRFLQVDPVRFNGGDISLYRYVMGMPGDFKDSLGLRRVRAIVDCVC